MANRQQIRTKTSTGAPAAADMLVRELVWNDVDNRLYIKKENLAVQEITTSDNWTYLKLSSDFTTSSATAVNITGLQFTPAANLQYEFEAYLLLRTATATVGPRTGLAWPTGLTDGAANLWVPTSATAFAQVFGNFNAALLGAVGGLPNTTQSYPSMVKGTVIAGASPSGNLRIQMASETGGTVVTVKAGSFLKYRAI